ncbi:DUF3119 family protein [Limnothrix sp. PR1529]|uniref:DUF3119 family protein n=1 Tax=Limnothrix sp. PR1529 TaxID=1704291 RepID=UPI000C14611B|nr:DUF3119 family protein [Limnothrix sp. PR1529]
MPEPNATPSAVQSPDLSPIAPGETTAGSLPDSEVIELPPDFVLPTGLAAISILFLAWNLLAALALAAFSAFLTLQAATLRLLFTATALDIYRGDKLIRRFPYQDWENWDIFWYYLPTLFYFKEVKSLHFLPILFDPKLLRACLEAKQLPKRRAWQ